MAFGLGSFGARSNADATVVLRAETGQFNREVDQAERNWVEATKSMSREAIRLDLAQDRLARSLHRYGAESSQAKRALLQLKEAEEAATRSSTRLGQAHSRLGISARSLGLGLVGGGGAVGVVYGLKKAVDAAKEAELVLGQTKLAVEAAGLSWEQYSGRIEAAVRAQARLGFDDEQLLKTFSTFVTRTRDVNEALRLNALATDVARGRYIDLESAAQIVVKASLGQSGALRRMGIDVDKNASSMQLLAKLTESYGGRAQGALGTATAATERMNVSIENARELIGSGLTPVVADLADRVSDYLDDAGRQQEIQEKVNQAVSDGAEIVRGFAGGIRAVRAATAPVVNALGGLERTAQLVVTALAVSRLLKIAGAIRAIGAASYFAAGGMGAMGAAGAAGGAAGGGWIAAWAKNAGKWGLAAAGVTAAATAASSAGTWDNARFVRRGNRYFAITTMPDGSTMEVEISEAAARKYAPQLFKVVDSGRAGPRSAGQAATEAGTNRKPPPPDTSSPDPWRLNLARALDTPGTGDELALYRKRVSYVSQQIRKLEADKNLTAKERDRLVRLYQEKQQAEDAIDAIVAENARKDQERAEKRERAARAAQAKRDRQAAIVARTLTPSPYANTSSGFNKAGIDPGLAKRPKTKDVVSKEDLDRAIRDLLMGWAEIQRKYAPNFQLDTHVLVEATREQTGVLKTVAAPWRFRDSPGLAEQMGVVMS